MTQQKAQEWAKRLERVWGTRVRTQSRPASGFRFRMKIAPLVTLEVSRPGLSILCAISCKPKGLCLIAHPDGNVTQSISGEHYTEPAHLTDADLERLLAQFALDWMPFFRRSCWLCGYPIEASAHEKLEWLEGFTPEEIEDWNLRV